MIIEFINSEYIHDILHILICKNKYITHTCHPRAVLCTITMRNDPSAKFTFIDCFIASTDYSLLPFQISLAFLQHLFSISQFFLSLSCRYCSLENEPQLSFHNETLDKALV